MWIALFSQSGSEIAGLVKNLGTEPILVLTNNMDESTWHPDVSVLNVVKNKHLDIVDKLRSFKPSFITLHGYLRIVPADICSVHNVWNGHPGDIINFPVLKGKDPQQKAIDLKLPYTGVVLHKVVAEVDAGDIYEYSRHPIKDTDNIETLISDLKVKQLDLWTRFLKGVI